MHHSQLLHFARLSRAFADRGYTIRNPYAVACCFLNVCLVWLPSTRLSTPIHLINTPEDFVLTPFQMITAPGSLLFWYEVYEEILNGRTWLGEAPSSLLHCTSLYSLVDEGDPFVELAFSSCTVSDTS